MTEPSYTGTVQTPPARTVLTRPQQRVIYDEFELTHLLPLEESRLSARPIDPELVRRLAALFATEDEIAFALDVEVQDLRARFGRQLAQGRAEVVMAIRRKQLQVAMKGNVGMLVHLGEQYLDQSKERRVEHTGEVDVNHRSDDPKAALLVALAEASARLSSLPTLSLSAPKVNDSEF